MEDVLLSIEMERRAKLRELERKSSPNPFVSAELRVSLEEAAKPLMRWMSENLHPHCSAVVDGNSVEVVEGLIRVVNNNFLKD